MPVMDSTDGMTREDWYTILDRHDHTDQWLDRTAFADWLRDHGQDEEAEAWDWIVRHKKTPCDCTDYTNRTDIKVNKSNSRWMNQWVFFSSHDVQCGWMFYAKTHDKFRLSGNRCRF